LAVLTCPTCGQENPEGARFCNACANPLQADERPLGEERKIVTVVFVDLVGFTAQAERLDPEDVRRMLSPYHARVRGELERRGGTVEKFIGDAVMAVFGAPVAHEDDPERAVRAALAIRDWAVEQPELQVRIAVSTGEALVNVGARPAEGEAMVAGDVVNTAARMQTAAPVNGVLVGEMTYRATRDAIRYRDAPSVQAKGKTGAVSVWEAVEPVARFGLDVFERARTPLIGRDRELELLRSLLARVREERSAQLVTLVGVPGIGKSRLVAELFRIVDDAPELITWRQGRCLPYGESVTFWALGEIVKAEAGILETDTPGEVEIKLHEAVSRSVAEASEVRWLEAELGALVGLTGDGRQAADASSAMTAWRRFLETLGEVGPAVLVFEDLHWADDGLLDFLDDLVDWLRTVPLLVVGTARPELLERRQAWGGGKANATTISLQLLGDSDTQRLISALLEQPLLLAEEQRALLDKAGGNPLFAEQYVRMLGERGTTGDLPESVQGVIAARLDALPRSEKRLLQEAAVHGKVFWLGGVAAATGLTVTDVDRLLRPLERKDFVRRERRSVVAGDTQYSFQHVLLRDVAYGQIPRSERAEKHRRAGEWIEGLGRPEDHAELLAHHYQQALELARAAGVEDDPTLIERARESLRAAGERALAVSAYASAAEFFSEALVLTSSGDPSRPRLLLQRARALFPLGGAGLDLLTEAIDGFRAAGDPEGAAEAATVAARFSWHAGDRSATDRYMAEALDAVADRPASRAKAVAVTDLCGFTMLEARYGDAIRLGAEALPLVEALEMEDQRARLHIVIGTSRWGLGDPDGLNEIEDGIGIAEAAGAVDMVAVGYDNLFSGLNCYGRLAEGRRALRRMIELSRRYGLARRLRGGRQQAACSDYVDGHWDEAIAVADELIALADAGDRDFTDAVMLSLRAWIRLARGDPAGADRDSERAVELARASDIQAQSWAYTIRAGVALEAGNRAEAEGLASELVVHGAGIAGALNLPFPTLVDVAWLFRDLGREDEFSALLDAVPIRGPWKDASKAIVEGDLVRAAEIIDAMGYAAGAAYARLRAAEALAAAGRQAEAAPQRAQAEAFYRTVQATHFVGNGSTSASEDDLRASMDR
jgi:class 3 adenylate cyclase/tetratricopeptide (TPR) repeat protein